MVDETEQLVSGIGDAAKLGSRASGQGVDKGGSPVSV